MSRTQDAYEKTKAGLERAGTAIGNVLMAAGLRRAPNGHVGDGYSVLGRDGYSELKKDDENLYGHRMKNFGAIMAMQEKPYLDAAVARFENAPDAEIVRMLGKPGRAGEDHAIPPRGAARRNEIRDMAMAAFQMKGGDLTASGHDREFKGILINRMRDSDHVDRVMSGEENVHEVNSRIVSNMVDRTVHLQAGGSTRDARIEAETHAIMAAPDFDNEIASRFRHSPRTDLRSPPSDVAGRREWVSGELRMEAALIDRNLVDPQDVFDIARTMRGPIPRAPAGAVAGKGMTDFLDQASAGYVRGEDFDAAKNLHKMPDAALRHRFRDIPGIETAEIGENREVWIMQAAAIERTRERMSMSGIVDVSAAAGRAGHDVAKDRKIEPTEVSASMVGESRRPGVAFQMRMAAGRQIAD